MRRTLLAVLVLAGCTSVHATRARARVRVHAPVARTALAAWAPAEVTAPAPRRTISRRMADRIDDGADLRDFDAPTAGLDLAGR